VTLEHKTSHKGLEIYIINNISIDVWLGQYLKIWNLRVQKNLNIENLAMHITNQKYIFYIFVVGNVLNIFMEHDPNILMIFGIK